MRQIRSFAQSDIPEVKKFTDREIGLNYYNLGELEEIYRKSFYDQKMCSLVLESEGRIEGIRITFPPGQWSQGKGEGLTPHCWPFPIEETAYFQSLFIAKALTGHGYGRQLSLKSIDLLKSIGAQGVVCHSWKESPHDSSGRYLRALGFQLVATHPYYWSRVDYTCPRCGKPCLCTAEEMYLVLAGSRSVGG